MLSTKDKSILLVLSETEYCTASTIARALGVSSKTARKMLKDLRDRIQEYGADILSSTRKGYLLKIQDRIAFQSLQEGGENSVRFVPSTSEERAYYILLLLLGQTGYLKLDEVSERIYVNKYTLSGDLKRLENWLQNYRLTIERRPNYGIRLVGREIDIRNCTAYVLEKYNNMMPDGGYEYRRQAKQISKALLEIVQKHKLRFSEYNFQNLVNVVFATIHRTLLQAFIPLKDEEIAVDVNHESCAASKELAKELDELFHVELPKTEVCFLSLNLVGKGNYSESRFPKGNMEIAPELMALVEEMLKSVYENFRLDYSRNFLLQMNLGQHMVAMDIRLRYNLPVENPLLEEVWKNYSFAYALAEQAAIPLAHHYGTKISEDEIGFLAYIFQLSIEQEKQGVQKKNILIVCAAGNASSKLIAYRFQEEFGKYLNRIEVCNVYELENFDLSGVDYIFTSVPVERKVQVPLLRVEDFLNRNSMSLVREILQGSNEDFLSAYYQQELFFPHIQGESKEEAIFDLCNRINEVIRLPQGFYASVLQREDLARTDFCPKIAFPHSLKNMANQTFVAIGILDKPIHWVKNQVQVLFLISIGDGDSPELQRFYMTATAFMQDTKRVESLIKCREFSWFLRLLCEEEPGDIK